MAIPADALFRRIEKEVLDEHHRHCALLRRSQPIAIEAVLRCYAQVLRDLRTGVLTKPTDDARTHTANEGLRGLAHCMRWIDKECWSETTFPSKVLVPELPQHALANEALEMLRWAVKYDPIWNEHSAYSGGLVGIGVDESNKVVTFLPKKDANPHFFCTQIESKKADDKRLRALYPEERLAQLSRDWYESSRPGAGGILLDDAAIRRSGAISVAVDWLEKTCLPELSATTSLVGCTLNELRQVLAALHVHSLYATKLEDVADGHQETRGRIASYVHSRPFVDMVAWLASLAGVPVNSTEAIMSVLTFDPKHPHVTLAEQPLVRAKNGQLFLLPRMLLMLDLPRMYAGAINKTRAGRKAYERVINDIENAGVAAIAADMRNAVKSAAQVAEKATFRLPNGLDITPDLVVASDERAEVLVIDVKHALPPLGPLDVRHDVEEATAWKKRMAEYVSAIQQHPEILTQKLPWNRHGKVSVVGLILLRWPLPIPIDFAHPIYAVDWPSLREHFRQSGFVSAGELTDWAARRPDVTLPRALVWMTKEVKAGEWTWRYSVLSPAAEERQFELKQKLAYRLWEGRGKPLWDDLRDWHEAEARIAADPYAALDFPF